ncbi:hypothetical protein [Parvularcula lutaonensis]|uniref:Uncharacterized protein n=1 Tax=Parvularcula lutaonensis TaxID=491923 RepID=A0ABV7M8B2_9PROT|nr:hypothetical protein [Parvularcula lutaonensis]
MTMRRTIMGVVTVALVVVAIVIIVQSGPEQVIPPADGSAISPAAK